MGGHCKPRENVTKWPNQFTEEFLKIMAEYAMQRGTKDKKSWDEISDKLEEKFQVKYDFDKCRQKKCCLHRTYRSFKELINHTRVTWNLTWNPDTNIIEADETVWNRISTCGCSFKMFRNGLPKFYELMDQAFVNQSTTSHLACSSTQAPLNSDEERWVENEFKDIGQGKQPMRAHEKEGTYPIELGLSPTSATGSCSGPPRKRGNYSCRSVTTFNFADALINRFDYIAVKDISATSATPADSPASCVKRLQSLAIELDVLNHTVNFLIKNPDAHSFFASMTDDVAVLWCESLFRDHLM